MVFKSYISANDNVHMKLFQISSVPETGCPMGHTGLTIDHASRVERTRFGMC